MNSRIDNDTAWYSCELSTKKFNFDDPDDNGFLPLFGAKKETVAQLARDARDSYKLQAKDDVDNDSVLTSGSKIVPASEAYHSARFKHYQPSVSQLFTAGQKERPITATEISKLEAEVEMLKRKLRELTNDKWAPLPPKTVILRIIMGETFSLDAYKSKEQKLALLDSALKYHDGNAIMTVVLHLKKTWKPSLFYQELRSRPVAMNQYINYLNSHQEFTKLSDIYTMLGRTSEAAVLNYKLALKSKDLKSRITSLQSCHTNHFKRDSSLELDAALVMEHLSLLELQSALQAHEEKLLRTDFQSISTRSPVMSTLHYCCLHHYNLPESHAISPLNICKTLKLNERQLIWAAVSARAKLKQWKDIEALLTTKGLFGSSKLKFVIPPKKLLQILHSYNADQEVLQKYIEKIENNEERLRLAKKYKCHKLVVDTLVALKDRKQLLEYKTNVLPHSTDFIYLQNALGASTIRWKN